MAVTAKRSIVTNFAGDISLNTTQRAGDNATSLAEAQILDLAGGDNTVTAPASSGSTLAGVTIMPPAGNTEAITLKGAGGDTGIALHKTDPTSLGLDPGVTSFILNAAGAVVGLRLLWT